MPEPATNVDPKWDFEVSTVLDTLEAKPTYLLTGEHGSQVKLSASAYYLLRSVRSGMSMAQLAQTLNEREECSRVSVEQLQAKYDSLLARLRMIEMQTARQELPWGFWVRFCLIPEKIAARIASAVSCLYHPLAVITMIAMMAGAIFTAFHRGLAFTFSGRSFLPGLGLFMLVLLAHEFGHASACARFGARPSDIGFTVYLIYPAFYSDVSAAWKLKRFQRVVVDLGGCYFQAIVSSAFLFAYYRTGWEPLRAAIIFSLYSALFSLNPIFKFDGYWVLADSLGVSNLSRQPGRIFRYLLDTVRRRPVERLPWPSSVTGILFVYSCLTMFVWTYFVLRLFPMLKTEFVGATHAGMVVAMQLAGRRLPAWPDVSTLLASMAFLLFAAITLWNIASRPMQALVRRAKSVSLRFIRESAPMSSNEAVSKLTETGGTGPGRGY